MKKTNLDTRRDFQRLTEEGLIQLLLESHKLVRYIVQPEVSYVVTINTLRYLECVDESVLKAVEKMISEGKVNPNTKVPDKELRAAIKEQIDPNKG